MASPAVSVGEILAGGDTGLAALAPQVDLLLASGGDGDIWPDPADGRTPWDTHVAPADHEIWFSSTAAQSISRPAYDQTLKIFARLTRRPACLPLSLSAWFDGVRSRIAMNFGAEAAGVLLLANAADAREAARSIAQILLRRSIIEIATPQESTQFVESRRDGLTELRIELRTENGEPREQADIDSDALQLSEAALESGQALLLHLLDTSKTGLAGISRDVARALQRAAPSRALALVDASEGRVYPNEIRRDLARGMMVLLSGSQFIGGPPFSAALLLPPDMAAELAAMPAQEAPWPSIARFDAPGELRKLFAPTGTAIANPGLGLRWSAALAEYEAYARVNEPLRREILETFSRKARAMAARCAFLSVEALLPENADDPLRASIVSLIPLTPQGPRKAIEYAAAIRAALARPCNGHTGDAICHIGQPVAIGARAALPIAASAPMVSAVARRMAMGVSFDRAMNPVLRDLETLFRKWDVLAG